MTAMVALDRPRARVKGILDLDPLKSDGELAFAQCPRQVPNCERTAVGEPRDGDLVTLEGEHEDRAIRSSGIHRSTECRLCVGVRHPQRSASRACLPTAQDGNMLQCPSTLGVRKRRHRERVPGQEGDHSLHQHRRPSEPATAADDVALPALNPGEQRTRSRAAALRRQTRTAAEHVDRGFAASRATSPARHSLRRVSARGPRHAAAAEGAEGRRRTPARSLPSSRSAPPSEIPRGRRRARAARHRVAGDPRPGPRVAGRAETVVAMQVQPGTSDPRPPNCSSPRHAAASPGRLGVVGEATISGRCGAEGAGKGLPRNA